jgi:RNase P protein component
MFTKSHRLTTKDVRYIQKQRNVIWTQHFGILRIPQYPNKKYHQTSIYIAADTVRKASRRHALKRQMLEYIQLQILPQQWVSQKYYKFFIFLNKKTVTAWQLGDTKISREDYFKVLYQSLQKERSTVNKKLSL